MIEVRNNYNNHNYYNNNHHYNSNYNFNYNNNHDFKMDASVTIEMARERERINKQFELMLNTLKNEGVAGTQAALNQLEKTPTNHLDSIKEKLLAEFRAYQEPLCSQEEFCQILNRRAKENAKRDQQRNLEKAYEEAREEERRETPRVIALPDNPALPGGFTFLREPESHSVHPNFRQESTTAFDPEKKITKGQNGKTICFSPATGDQVKLPLKYPALITLEAFETKTERFSLTKTLHYKRTLESYLRFAQEIGMSRSQYCEGIKLLIKKEKASFAFTLENLKDDEEIFKQALCLINTEELKSVIKSEIKHFSRKPGSHLRETFSRYYTLMLEKIRGEQPYLQESKAKVKAERLAALVVPDLVSPVTKQEYLKWLDRRKKMGEDSTKDDILTHLSDLEDSDEKYALTEEQFPSAQIPLTEVALHHQSGDLGADLFVNDAYAKSFSANKRLQKGDSNNWQRGNNNQQQDKGSHNSRKDKNNKGGKNKPNNKKSNNSNQPNQQPQQQSQQQRQQQQNQQRRRSPSNSRPQQRSATPHHPPPNDNNSNNAKHGGNNNSNQWKGKGKGKKERNKSNDSRNNNNNSNNSNLYCAKCDRSGSHDAVDCWTYPGEVMSSPCRWCKRGFHHSDKCRNSTNSSNSTNNKSSPPFPK